MSTNNSEILKNGIKDLPFILPNSGGETTWYMNDLKSARSVYQAIHALFDSVWFRYNELADLNNKTTLIKPGELTDLGKEYCSYIESILSMYKAISTIIPILKLENDDHQDKLNTLIDRFNMLREEYWIVKQKLLDKSTTLKTYLES